jgi:serine/threonine-protein kinase HipA
MATTFEQRRHKEIEDGLDVHAWTPEGFLRAGVMQLEEIGDRQMLATFAYEEAYLEHRAAYPLDPVNMPLGSTEWQTQASTVHLGAIFDAAPDAWGRRVVRASMPAASDLTVVREAFLRGADGIGAVLLTPVSARPASGTRQDIDALVEISRGERPALSRLQEAGNAARLVEDGADISSATRRLLAGSWTIGGARPKAILRDDRPGAAAERSVIAKFESSVGGGWRNRLEWASLELARCAGLPTPAHDLVEMHDAARTASLVLDRFDRVDGAEGRPGHRLHYLSAASLVSAEHTSPRMDSRRDVATFSWKHLLDVASAVTVSASRSRVEMFARLCLNAALRNTDDHLKNFGFLKVPDDPVHYAIAPVFDVSPQAADQHYLWCGESRVYTLDAAIGRARSLGISAAAAGEVRDRIMGALEKRFELYEEAGMSQQQVDVAEQWILAGTPDAPQRPGAAPAERMRG